MRPDPLRDRHPVAQKRRTRFSASSLRGVRLLPKGIFPAASIKATGNQSINNSQTKVVNFDTVNYDPPGDDGESHADALMAVVATERLIIRYTGFYTIVGTVAFASNSTGFRLLALSVNGLGVMDSIRNAVSGTYTAMSVQMLRHLDVDDYIRLSVFQNSGGALNLLAQQDYPVLAAAWVAL